MNPTLEEILRVHAAECARNGHSWEELYKMQDDVPYMLLCSHCGKRATVQEVRKTGNP